jgi:hypothetical protein
MKITVVNRYKHTPTNHDLLIDRSTNLGNPFTHRPINLTLAKYKVATRKESLIRFSEYLESTLSKTPNFIKLIEVLKGFEEINLVCTCSPKECHGDILKEYILSKVKL